jgi:CubicO group peptidase (beta-lactamase class C family)
MTRREVLLTGLSARALAQGLSSSKLEQIKNALASHQTKALVVLRRGEIVYEWYAAGGGPEQLHYTASLAKAIVGGMSLVLALQDGRMKVDDPAWKYIPAWKADPLRSKITIRQLATHSSGIEDANDGDTPHAELPGWKGEFWKRNPDPFTIAIHQAPVIFEPGTRFHYSNPGMAALAYAVTASLKGAPQADIRSLLRERIMSPLGIPDKDWQIGYGRAYKVDGLELYANWGGGGYTPRAVARVGQLMLERGRWQERQLVHRTWVARVTAPAGTPLADRKTEPYTPASGLCWYTNADGVWPAVPRDAFAGAGAGHQVLLVVPSLDLVVVRNGGTLARGDFWTAVYQQLFEPLIGALGTSESPYPQSKVVRKVTFAPESSIARSAVDSDNWPMTWGDDDDQYTSYGDGRGFEPGTDRKLSMGFARVTGPAAAYRGINVRSESGERTGNGKAGAKASGIVMVNGVLYMWVRNTGNSQLTWSEDHARTWQWGFRLDTSFGSPCFLNFGRNYQGARDEYVYSYSQDGPSAYESYDRIVMARVRKEEIRDRKAYEFFVRLDESGRPVWTREISRRGGVLNYPGHCQRSDAVYNAGIKRYLLALGYNHNGGWGIFDAPEPWGPWTTAFHTENWGLGGTHGYRLPAKWISPDGKSMYLVFSGVRPYDAFCVRGLTLDAAK